ncbi:hypothetical protein CCACVL1_23728 [Corchorus capsularis]|uniref:Uncharacterized protein n=1 Tax=Corchorus capsularis TaxID=210143 RepID=A0A1R3GSU6_COCAP|nr:hypothetical protein CCACVL1_23728 [Corchorus capsularis]
MAAQEPQIVPKPYLKKKLVLHLTFTIPSIKNIRIGPHCIVQVKQAIYHYLAYFFTMELNPTSEADPPSHTSIKSFLSIACLLGSSSSIFEIS